MTLLTSSFRSIIHGWCLWPSACSAATRPPFLYPPTLLSIPLLLSFLRFLLLFSFHFFRFSVCMCVCMCVLLVRGRCCTVLHYHIEPSVCLFLFTLLYSTLLYSTPLSSFILFIHPPNHPFSYCTKSATRFVRVCFSAAAAVTADIHRE